MPHRHIVTSVQRSDHSKRRISPALCPPSATGTIGRRHATIVVAGAAPSGSSASTIGVSALRFRKMNGVTKPVTATPTSELLASSGGGTPSDAVTAFAVIGMIAVSMTSHTTVQASCAIWPAPTGSSFSALA